MPPSTSRRDTEDMLSRVSRTEAESSEAYRRIEEHLRTVQRRLDSAERSQSENNRAMSKTTTEINIATREQAQAFDQLAAMSWASVTGWKGWSAVTPRMASRTR